MSSSRDAILAATRALIVRDGAGVPMRDIAAAAGVSRQAVYLHFATRGSLLMAVVREMDDEHEIVARCERALRADDPVDALRRFLREWLRFAVAIRPVAVMLLAARPTDADVAAAWEDRMADLRRGHRVAAERLEAAGQLRAGLDAPAAADLAWALTSVAVVSELLGRGWSAARVERELVAAVVAALVRAAPPV